MEEIEAIKILKEETKLTLSDLHDFAKWKLTAAAALASIGLGLTRDHSQASLWLLVFIPYVCLFVDLNIYNYNLRLLVISKVIKESCKANNLIRIYECTCEEKGCCRNGVFTPATLAQLGSSIMFSMLSICAFFQSSGRLLLAAEIACWGIGMLLIALFYMDYKSKRNEILGKSVSTSCSS